MHPSFRLSAAALAVFFVPSLAQAHITLTDPPARHPAADLKAGPCGNGPGDSRTTDPAKITEYTAGETVTIYFTETVQHPGHYRVMLSSTGDTGFTDPTGYEDISMSEGDLIDGVMDEAGGFGAEEHEITVTLPSEPCEECTIQLIQVMYDKEPWGPEPNPPNGADIYYQCADIVILPSEGGGTGGAAGTGGAGSGGVDGGSGGASVGSGGSSVGSGGSSVGSGGSSVGSGGSEPAAAGGSVGMGSGGLPGSGGDGVIAPPPPSTGTCSLGGPSPRTSSLAWLGLAGLSWFFSRRRRARA